MGETRGTVGGRGKSQRAAHARGARIRAHATISAPWDSEGVTKLLLFLVKVLKEKWQQLKLRMQKNHEAQVGSLREREELIQRLELEREARRQKRELEEQRVATPVQEVSIQVSSASHF